MLSWETTNVLKATHSFSAKPTPQNCISWNSPFRDLFLHEMSLAAEAAFRAFQPEKMNYELLGQGDNIHMHWHFFPRRKGDTPVPGPVWKLPKEEMYADKYLPSDSELQEMKQKLNTELEKLLQAE